MRSTENFWQDLGSAWREDVRTRRRLSIPTSLADRARSTSLGGGLGISRGTSRNAAPSASGEVVAPCSRRAQLDVPLGATDGRRRGDSSANDGILRAGPAQPRWRDACIVTHHRSRTECRSARARALDQIIKKTVMTLASFCRRLPARPKSSRLS
jgi:hypothetical protein